MKMVTNCEACGAAIEQNLAQCPCCVSGAAQTPKKIAFQCESWWRGFILSVPVAIASWIGLTSGLENILVPLTVICVLLSLPWNLFAALIIGFISSPIVSYFQIHGYLWLVVVVYSALILGAHYNGCLLFNKIAASK